MKAVADPSYRKRIGYQAGLLGGFSTLAATLLVAGNMITKAPIEEQQRQDLMASLATVVPDETHDNNLLDDSMEMKWEGVGNVTIYRALRDGVVTGVAYRITGYGYAGAINCIMGLDATGKVMGVRVLSHAETPGLGDKIEVERDDWILSFNGLSMGAPPESEWAVKKDGGRFDQFTGATITPRGVVAAVKGGVKFFEQHKAELLASRAAIAPDRIGD